MSLPSRSLSPPPPHLFPAPVPPACQPLLPTAPVPLPWDSLPDTIQPRPTSRTAHRPVPVYVPAAVPAAGPAAIPLPVPLPVSPCYKSLTAPPARQPDRRAFVAGTLPCRAGCRASLSDAPRAWRHRPQFLPASLRVIRGGPVCSAVAALAAHMRQWTSAVFRDRRSGGTGCVVPWGARRGRVTAGWANH